MKQISAELKAHIEQEVTTLATCWRVTRRDGEVMGFTDCDRDIEYDELLYIAATGFTPTAVENSAALNVDNMDIEGMLDAGSITEADLIAGRYDYAEIEVFLLNYNNVTQGKLHIKTGWLGEVTVRAGQFVAEVRGLSQPLSQKIGSLYSAACRAQLGDARCGVNAAALIVTGTITGVTSQSICVDALREEDAGYFSYGKITFNSGANAGLSMEIKEYSNGQFILSLPMAYPLAIGDAYSVQPGCDKTISTCVARFDNALNFRGEPHVPGIDRVLETASTRSNW